MRKLNIERAKMRSGINSSSPNLLKSYTDRTFLPRYSGRLTFMVKPPRDTPIQDLGLVVRRLLNTTFTHRCPACGKAKLFKSFFYIHETCPHCQVRYERDRGGFTGSYAVNYFPNMILGVLFGVWLIRSYGFFDGVMFVIIGFLLLTSFLTYQSTKALWIGLLWAFGFVYADAQTNT